MSAAISDGRPARTGADELRLIVSNMDACTEDFNCRYSAEQLLTIFRMQLASEWDFYPDQWTDRQVREALAGKPPRWDAAGDKPLHQPVMQILESDQQIVLTSGEWDGEITLVELIAGNCYIPGEPELNEMMWADVERMRALAVGESMQWGEQGVYDVRRAS